MSKRISVEVLACLVGLVSGCGSDAGEGGAEYVQRRANALSVECGTCVGDATNACVQAGDPSNLASCLLCDQCAVECAGLGDCGASASGAGGSGGSSSGVGGGGGGNPVDQGNYCYSLGCNADSANGCFSDKASYCAALCSETTCPALAADACAANCP